VDKMASMEKAMSEPCWKFTNDNVPLLLILKKFNQTGHLTINNTLTTRYMATCDKRDYARLGRPTDSDTCRITSE